MIFRSRILLALGLTITLGVPDASPQQTIVRRISIHGNAHFREDVLNEMMGIEERRPLPAGWPDTSMTSLLSGYHRQGFYSARIDSLRERVSSDSAFIDLDIWVFEGRRLATGRIKIRGVDDGWRREFGEHMEMQEGGWFDEAILEQDIQRILGHLENNGHPLGRVAIDSLSLNHDRDPPRMDMILDVDAGPEVKIESIRVQGNRFTKENVILRESRLKVGAPYHHKNVLSVRERLQRLGFFQEVGEPEVAFSQDRAAVELLPNARTAAPGSDHAHQVPRRRNVVHPRDDLDHLRRMDARPQYYEIPHAYPRAQSTRYLRTVSSLTSTPSPGPSGTLTQPSFIVMCSAHRPANRGADDTLYSR